MTGSVPHKRRKRRGSRGKATWGQSPKAAVCNPRTELSPDTNPCHLDPDFLPPELGENIFLLFQPHTPSLVFHQQPLNKDQHQAARCLLFIPEPRAAWHRSRRQTLWSAVRRQVHQKDKGTARGLAKVGLLTHAWGPPHYSDWAFFTGSWTKVEMDLTPNSERHWTVWPIRGVTCATCVVLGRDQ